MLITLLLLGVAASFFPCAERSPSHLQIELKNVNGDHYEFVSLLVSSEFVLPSNISELMFIPRTKSLRSPCIRANDFCSRGNTAEYDLIYVTSVLETTPTFSQCSDHFVQCAENSLEPAVDPSHSPSIQPSVTPTQSPSVTPTVDPSHSPSNQPSNPPSHYPLIHLRLNVKEDLLWHKENIEMFKKEVSKLYDIPEENILLVSMVPKGEQVEVGIEIKGGKTPQVNFEDEVYLTEKLSETSIGKNNIVVPLEMLEKHEKYETFRHQLCVSLLQNELSLEGIDHGKLLIIKNVLKDLWLRLDREDVKQLYQPSDGSTFHFTLPLSKSQLDSSASILRLKEALSFHLESSPDDLSVLTTNSISPNSRQTRVVMKCRSCYQEKLENFELDREQKLDIVDHVLEKNSFVEFAMKHLFYFVFICWCCMFGLLFYYVRSKTKEIRAVAFQAVPGDNSNAPRARLLEDNNENFLWQEPGQPIQNLPAYSAVEIPGAVFERIGEASDYPESEEEFLDCKEGIFETEVDLVLSPVIFDVLTDDEILQKPEEEPITVINPIPA